MAVSVSLNVIFAVILIPRFGASGAAFATTLALGIGVIIAFMILSRQFIVKVPWKSIIRIGIAAGILGVVARFVSAQGIMILIVLPIGMCFYFIMLFLFREVTPNEIKQLINSEDGVAVPVSASS